MVRIIILAAVAALAFDTLALAAGNPSRDLAAEHALLTRFEGSWTEIMTFKKTPDAEPVLINGAATNKVVLGGRFLEQRTRGMAGESFHDGIAFIGFEPENERFSSVWFDNASTTFSSIYGKLNPVTQELEFCGPSGKNDGCTYVWVQSLPRNDKYRWSFKQVHADGTTGWSMSAVGTRLIK